MPHTDPVTGVAVMTMGEFFAAEAERGGSAPGQLATDLYAEIERECQAEADRLRDPAHALDVLCEAVTRENAWRAEEMDACAQARRPIDGDAYAAVPAPVEVIEVRRAEYRATIASEATRLEAIARRSSGNVGLIAYSRDYLAGSYLDPPEDEEEVCWLPLDATVSL